MKPFFAYIIGLTLYILTLAVLSCNNDTDDLQPNNDTLNQAPNQRMPDNTLSNDTTSYPRMNDRIPDSAQ